MIKFYQYKGCSTCRKAQKFLEENGVDFDTKAIVETPPTKAELKKMASYLDGGARKLFNVSGQVYREMKLKDKLDDMSESEMIGLLAENGKLIKRPFLMLKNQGTVGFKEDAWRGLLGV